MSLPSRVGGPGSGTATASGRVEPRTVDALLAACLGFLVLIGLALIASGCGDEPPGPSPSPDPVVARVEGVPLTESDVQTVRRVARFSDEELSDIEALEQAVREELIRQEAARLGVDVSAADVDERVAALADDLGGQDELRRRLREAGLTMAQMRTGIASVETAERLQDARYPDLRATSAEARRFYDENLDLFTTPAEVELGDLAVRRKAIAADVIDRVEAGQSFASAARQFSADPELRAGEGMLGWVLLDSLPEEARDVVDDLRVGELSRPLLLGNLWHVFKLLDRRPARTLPFREVSDGIVAELTRRERAQALAGWLEEARASADVVIVSGSPSPSSR